MLMSIYSSRKSYVGLTVTVFMVMKEHVTLCKCNVVVFFLLLLDNNGALWHRGISYQALAAQTILVGRISSLVGFGLLGSWDLLTFFKKKKKKAIARLLL